MHRAAKIRSAPAKPRRPAHSERGARRTAHSSEPDADHSDVLSLQRQVGNQAVARLIQRKDDAANEANFASVAKLMARLGAGTEKDLVDWYKTLAGYFSTTSAALLKAARHVSALSKKSGASLFKELLHIAPRELELYWSLASSLAGRYPRLANAVLLVRGFREPGAGLELALAEIGPDLKEFLAALPPDEVRKGFTGLSLFRLFAIVQAAKGPVKEQVVFALFDTLLKASEGEAEQFAREITDQERWMLENYLYSDFSTKFSKGREVRDRLRERFTLNIEGHSTSSHRL